jgi:hypothetical protein
VSPVFIVRDIQRNHACSEVAYKRNTTPQEALALGEAPGEPVSQLQKVGLEYWDDQPNPYGSLGPREDAHYLCCIDDSYRVTGQLGGPRRYETEGSGSDGGSPPEESPFQSPALGQTPPLSSFDALGGPDYFQQAFSDTVSPLSYPAGLPVVDECQPPPSRTARSRTSSVVGLSTLSEQPDSNEGGKVRKRRKSSVSSLASSLSRSHVRSRKPSVSESPRGSISSLPTTRWYRELGLRGIWTLVGISQSLSASFCGS